jgi:hypothetical protein
MSLFQDSGTATGTVGIDDDPTLNYRIDDRTSNNKASYEISYQVEWVVEFDRIDIRIKNTDDTSSTTESFSTAEGGTTFTGSGGTNGDTYEFTFWVYKTGQDSPILEKTVSDIADGADTQGGDFGGTTDAKLERIDVRDNTSNNKAAYTVEYEVSNYETDFGEVEVSFDNLSGSNKDASDTSSDTPTGSVTYSEGGTSGDEYEITVDVRNSNGLIVDSETIPDTADRTDTQWTR